MPDAKMTHLKIKRTLGAICASGALLACAAPASATTYHVVVPVKGRVAPIAPEITVTLNSYTLPSGAVGTAYSASLKPLAVIQGDPTFNGTGLAWTVGPGGIPAGLSLSPDGTVSGTPSAAGAGVVAARVTYKGKSGEQSYPLTIDSAPDPYWSSVVLLASPAAGTYRDHSGYAAPLTPGTGVTIDTATARFTGTASMRFVSTSTGISVPYSTVKFDLNSTNKTWTVEAWVYLQGPQSSIQAFRLDVLGSAGGSNGWETMISNSGMGVMYPGSGGPVPSKAISSGQWHHLAWQRSNNNYSFAVDGVIATVDSYSGGLPGSFLKIGGNYSNNVGITYNIQELRVTNGVLRYPTKVGATYTVPTEPFPRK